MSQAYSESSDVSDISETGGISEVSVEIQPCYSVEESEPDYNYYFWGYHVVIRNSGATAVKLTKRFWQIIDCNGEMQEVEGNSVAGEQPVIEAGQTYGYTSGVTMTQPSGIMAGYYEMVTLTGETFRVSVPAFSLDSPHESSLPH